MRKVIVSMMVSVDGFFEGPSGELDWFVWDDEMEKYMTDFFGTVDTFLYGRRAYDLMVKYWPSATGSFANKMNSFPKIVFSRTLREVEWNARLVKENIVGEVEKLKRQDGKDLVLFAGAEILSTFIQYDLVDEYRLIINPVVLGSGNPLFRRLTAPLKLELVRAQTFSCGNVIGFYQPKRD